MRAKYEDLRPDHEIIKKAEFWGEEGQERLIYTEIDDCIGGVLDEIGDLDTTIEVCAFEKVSIEISPEQLVRDVLEHLDEEYGDPEGDYTDPTPQMLHAANLLALVIKQEYEPWVCEQIGVVEVNGIEWAKEHQPEWLEVPWPEPLEKIEKVT